jgi:hypothetical protein
MTLNDILPDSARSSISYSLAKYLGDDVIEVVTDRPWQGKGDNVNTWLRLPNGVCVGYDVIDPSKISLPFHAESLLNSVAMLDANERWQQAHIGDTVAAYCHIRKRVCTDTIQSVKKGFLLSNFKHTPKSRECILLSRKPINT